ncbi:glycosyltransferase family 61 protein [Halorussus salinisoli]|uniref:glycosyltransferase family 61 protein n=1 Tax=Halorussus salinisoli TaxID=2558242 RepID=UPI0010C18EDE|nr:glycosyltransferase family 61 protein [Halorussus salinisoli]
MRPKVEDFRLTKLIPRFSKEMNSPVEIARDAVHVYRNQGLVPLLRMSRKFVHQQLLRPWHITGDEIYDKCQSQIPVQSSEKKTVSYEGSFRDSLPRHLANIEGEIETPERVIGEYQNARVLGPGMIVGIDYGYIVPVEVGSERRYSHRLADNVSIRTVLQNYVGHDDAECRLDRAFLLTGKRGLAFAHWFYETLPKLRWYERYCTLIGQAPPLMIPSGITDWQRDSLALMGYPDESWIELDCSVTEVNTLAVPPHPYRNRGSRFTGSPANLRWVRNRILSNVTESNRSLPNRIYISRSDADYRRVRNEKELLNTLAKMGFVKFALSELSFRDQVRLFANADIVVGPHGAGLTNIIYSTDVDVVELLTDEGASEHFLVLANELGHSYEFVLCDLVGDDGIPPRHSDMIADPARVRAVIEAL